MLLLCAGLVVDFLIFGMSESVRVSVKEKEGYKLDPSAGACVVFQITDSNGNTQIIKNVQYESGEAFVVLDLQRGLYTVRVDAITPNGYVYLQHKWSFTVGNGSVFPFSENFENGTGGWKKWSNGQPVELCSPGADNTGFCAADQIDFSSGKNWVGVYKECDTAFDISSHAFLSFFLKWEQSGIVLEEGQSIEFKVELCDEDGNVCSFVSSNSVFGKLESGQYWGFQKPDVYRKNLPPDSGGWGWFLIPLDVFSRFNPGWCSPVDLTRIKAVRIGASSFSVQKGVLKVYVDEINFFSSSSCVSFIVPAGDSALSWEYGNSNVDNFIPRISKEPSVFDEFSFVFPMKNYAPARFWFVSPFYETSCGNYTGCLKDFDYMVFWVKQASPYVELGLMVEDRYIYNKSWCSEGKGDGVWRQVVLKLPGNGQAGDFLYWDSNSEEEKPAVCNLQKTLGFYIKPTFADLRESPVVISRIVFCKADSLIQKVSEFGPVKKVESDSVKIFVKGIPDGADVTFQVMDRDGAVETLKTCSNNGKAEVEFFARKNGVYYVWVDALATAAVLKQFSWSFIKRKVPPTQYPVALPTVVSASKDSEVVFVNLPQSCVKVFVLDMLGRKVKTVTVKEGEAVWDLLNEAGKKIRPGVYIFVASDIDNKPLSRGRVVVRR